MTLQTDRPMDPADTPSSDPQADASTTSQADTSTALTQDELFHLLQTSRRRETIKYLIDENDPVKMRDVAEHVSAREHGTTVPQLTSTQRQRVYIPLYQSHLPKLDKKDVIEYDQSRGIVRPDEQLELFRPYIEALEDDSPQSDTESDRVTNAYIGGDNTYYATMGALIVSLALVSTADALTISKFAVAAIITILFALTMVVFAQAQWNLPERIVQKRIQ